MYTAIVNFFKADSESPAEMDIVTDDQICNVVATVEGSGIRFLHPAIKPTTCCFASLSEKRDNETSPVIKAGCGYADLVCYDANAGLINSFCATVMIRIK